MASLLQELYTEMKFLQRANYSFVSAVTVAALDIVSNFPEEVQHIWRAKWSLPKVLYILVRYYGLAYLIFQGYVNLSFNVPLNSCKGYFWFWILFGDIMFTAFVNAVFTVRTYALYGKNKKVLAFFILLCSVEYGVEFYTSFETASGAVRTAFDVPPGVPLPGCLTTASPIKLNMTLLSWVTNLVINSAFFVASLVKFIHWSRDNAELRRIGTVLTGRGRQPALITIVMRDGTVYYFLTVLVVIINMCATITQGGRWYPFTSSWLIVAYSFAGSHIILNLRGSANKDVVQSGSESSVSDISLGVLRPVRPPRYSV
ncbi:hypothetical protein CPC08DRAFT_708150, partial [Agrocybe pediades]